MATSTTRKRDRFFAGMGALLFLVTASALTIAVVFDSSSKPNTDQNANQTQTATCDPQIPVLSKVYPLPDYEHQNAPVQKLATTDLTVGTGAAAKNGDCLHVKYYGTLAKNGTKFDEDFSDTTALQFTLGGGQVIPGWDQGMAGMKVGGVRRLVIPASLAYGAQGQGSIPANATLVFLVKLLAIK